MVRYHQSTNQLEFVDCWSQNSLPEQNNTENMFIYKRTYDTESIESFQQKLHETKWDEIMSFQNPHDVYKAFLKWFSTLYDRYFSEKIKLKKKRLVESLGN